MEVKYFVFAGSNHYPSGGWNDYIGVCSSLEDAYKMLARRSFDWAQIVNVIHREVIETITRD